MAGNRESARGLPRLIDVPGTRLLAALLTALALGYIAWKIGQAPPQALQFAFNGLAVGAVYALLAMGFTLVYSTVWFFDLYYGAAAALGAYGVFYLRTDPSLGSRLDINSVPVNVVFGLVVAGVVAWTLHTILEPRLRGRARPHPNPCRLRCRRRGRGCVHRRGAFVSGAPAPYAESGSRAGDRRGRDRGRSERSPIRWRRAPMQPSSR